MRCRHHVLQVERTHVVGVLEDLTELFGEPVQFSVTQRESRQFCDVRDVLTAQRGAHDCKTVSRNTRVLDSTIS